MTREDLLVAELREEFKILARIAREEHDPRRLVARFEAELVRGRERLAVAKRATAAKGAGPNRELGYIQPPRPPEGAAPDFRSSLKAALSKPVGRIR